MILIAGPLTSFGIDRIVVAIFAMPFRFNQFSLESLQVSRLARNLKVRLKALFGYLFFCEIGRSE
jgi:hypothetical protein